MSLRIHVIVQIIKPIFICIEYIPNNLEKLATIAQKENAQAITPII